MAPKPLSLHQIVDNCGTHTHADVRTWLSQHPRFVMHCTPIGALQLNLVERFFRGISERHVKLRCAQNSTICRKATAI